MIRKPTIQATHHVKGTKSLTPKSAARATHIRPCKPIICETCRRVIQFEAWVDKFGDYYCRRHKPEKARRLRIKHEDQEAIVVEHVTPSEQYPDSGASKKGAEVMRGLIPGEKHPWNNAKER